MSAMARELVEKGGVGDSADQVWRQLDRERSKQLGPVQPASGETANEVASSSAPAPEDSRERGIDMVRSVREKKRPDSPPWPVTAKTEPPVQLSLFG